MGTGTGKLKGKGTDTRTGKGMDNINRTGTGTGKDSAKKRNFAQHCPYGIGPDAPISPKLILHISPLFSIIVGYSGYKFNNVISLLFYKCIIIIEN